MPAAGDAPPARSESVDIRIPDTAERHHKNSTCLHPVPSIEEMYPVPAVLTVRSADPFPSATHSPEDSRKDSCWPGRWCRHGEHAAERNVVVQTNPECHAHIRSIGNIVAARDDTSASIDVFDASRREQRGIELRVRRIQQFHALLSACRDRHTDHGSDSDTES